jgi:hypothetical protein
LYEQAALEPPAIVWCQSFYQMVTMPSLLIGLLHSDMWQLVAGDLTSRATPKSWNRYWNKIWPEIWLNGGMPILTRMYLTSRIYEFYKELEAPLIAQAKSEFGKALHSGLVAKGSGMNYLTQTTERGFQYHNGWRTYICVGKQ